MRRQTLKWSFRLLALGLAAVSFVLVAARVRSERTVEKVEWVAGGSAYAVQWASGLVMFTRVTGVDAGEFRYASWQNGPGEWATFSQLTISPAGFCSFVSPSGRSRVVVVPLWLPLALASVIPMLWAGWELRGLLRRSRRSRALRTGRCPGCGYDLRATQERCPECGAGRGTPGTAA